MSTAINMLGQTVGHWTVIAQAENVGRHLGWLCKCSECGATRVISRLVLGRDRPPECTGCGHGKRALPPREPRSTRSVAPITARVFELVGQPGRCWACQHSTTFLHGKCGVCGMRGTRDQQQRAVACG